MFRATVGEPVTASSVPLKIVTGSQIPDLQGVPVFVAHGDPDDHLRLTVLLAHALGGSTAGVHATDAVETCKRPQSPWRERREALSYLFQKRTSPSGGAHCHAVLVDIDALDPGPLRGETLWDDRDFCRQRAELLELLLEGVGHGGFVVVRPRPSADVSLKLEGLRGEESDNSEAAVDPSLDTLLDVVPPECRPVLLWIVNSDVLRVSDLTQALEAGDVKGFERFVLGVAYEAIPSHARHAARRLSVLRGLQPANGMLGPIPLFGGESGSTSIDPSTGVNPEADAMALEARAVHWLKQCGFLQSGPVRGGHTSLRMPRAVRNYLAPLAKLSMPDVIELQHRSWGAVPLGDLSLEEQLEAHHHAVLGGVLEDALSTARYYANDVRALAFQLSHEGHHADSAEIYRKLIEIDPEDAYAWEYFALNLARASAKDMPAERAEEVEAAYKKAYELDRKNPLYHGRLLGFRAERKVDVTADFHRGVKKYLTEYADQRDAISYFAEPVLRGMQRGRWGALPFDAAERWRPVFAGHDKLRPFLRQVQ